MKIKPSRKNVALIYDAKLPFDVAVLGGVAAYVRDYPNWEISIEESALNNQRLPDLAGWEGDGVIANFDNPKVAGQVAASGLAAVAFGGGYGGYASDSGIPYIATDNAAIARLAAGHLIVRGFRHLAYFGYTPTAANGWSKDREFAFRAFAKKAGCSFWHFRGPSQTGQHWKTFVNESLRWLKTIPRPVGIMTATDKRARRLLEVCRIGGICVPEEVAVIGVDNDSLLCELSFPSLTSIEQGTRAIGYRAAQVLDSMMRRKARPALRQVIAPIGVITRASTDTLAAADADAALAMRMIRENACERLTPAQVCKQVGRSRSGLEERFKTCFSTTLAKELARVRLDRALELVRKSVLPLKAIAQQCRYGSVQHMTSVFHQRLGKTPAAIRATRE